MATDTTQPQDATPHDLQPTSEATPPVSAPLHERIAQFYGNHHDFLLWLIANPSRPHAEGMRHLGLSELTLYSWRRDIAGFKAVHDAITQHRGDLRSEYAQAAMRQAVPALVDAMIARGLSTGRDGERAGERILETMGVLPKASDTQPVAAIAIRVVYETRPIAQGITVEGEAKQLP